MAKVKVAVLKLPYEFRLHTILFKAKLSMSGLEI